MTREQQTAIARDLVDGVLRKGGTVDHLCRVISDPSLQDALAEIIVKWQEQVKPVVTGTFTAMVRYIQPTHDELCKRFDWVNPEYAKTAGFAIISRSKDVNREEREIAFEYFHLNRTASTNDVLAEMEKQGFRPATYEELLAFATAYPDEQRRFPIVALGSIFALLGGGSIPYINMCSDNRDLNLHWADDAWIDDCRFLVVRK